MTNPRRTAFEVIRQVNGSDGYANLLLNNKTADFDQRDAGFTTELVAGTLRAQGTYDQIIEAASGRKLGSLQPAVVDLLRLGSHQILNMAVPDRAAVATTVELARNKVGNRVTGLVNAVLRKVAAQDLTGWLGQLTLEMSSQDELALRGNHPRWILDAFAEVLPAAELEAALAANNVAPVPTLVVRPGLATIDELLAAGAEPARYSPVAAYYPGAPSRVSAVAEGRAGVQDEGSQLVALALSRVAAAAGPWLDLCAGPGGKAALLAGLAADDESWLLASEAQLHRAGLVQAALAAYSSRHQVICADGTKGAWQSGAFTRVMADVPCSGLGALRRRPEARWRRQPADVKSLADLQRELLSAAITAAAPGGVVAYVTCSPHRAETTDVVTDVLDAYPGVSRLRAADYLPEVPDCAVGDSVQLWPHRHGTDAMFVALLRRDN